MAINLKFDLLGNPEPPSIVLANRNGNKLGQLNVNVESVDVSDKFNAASEFSFTLNKYIDGEPTPHWDKVKDFKLIYCPEWDLWFEIKVELDETTETVKTVFCTQLGQAELSQIKIYNLHINNEDDPNWNTNNETYKSTILYDKENTDISLLHRLLKDKAPHYSIAYVDESIQRIQKTFSFDDTSICDAFNEIAEEIGCLFIYDSNSTKGGKPSRTISVYDLQQNCNDCGHRGEFTDKCPKCESMNIRYGYGEDTTIFVTSDELATKGIQLVTDVDSVKNCFKLEAGDDLITATIRNCNPNGSDYIWRLSNDIKEDMSNELVEKLESYDAEYKKYYNEHESNLDSILLTQYNNLVEKYDEFYNTDSTCLNCGNKGEFYDKCSNPNCKSENLLTGEELQKISIPIVGYPALMNAYYNTIDFALYLQSGLMPNVEIGEKSLCLNCGYEGMFGNICSECNSDNVLSGAKYQASLLTTLSLSPVAVNVKEVSSISETTADSAVLSMAKVIIKSTYKVEILSSSLSTDKKWSGTFKITNYSDDTDTEEVIVNDIEVNNDAETFIQQKIEKALNKEDTDDYSVSGLFKKELIVTIVDGKATYSGAFYDELHKYALNPLKSFYDAADTCISILTEQGAGDETNKLDLYEQLYLPYFQKQEAIASEISIRENELTIIEGVYDETTKITSGGLKNNIQNCQSVIQNALNFENYLGEDLWKELCSFRREDKYSNSNYISDGLNNAQLFERALEFIEVAEEEIFKSAELQHSISATLNNLLSLEKFKPLRKSFKTGNWIRVQVDGKVYKLRLLEYGFGYGDSESISVEFSDVTNIKNGVTDVKEVLEQASSMASSYDSVQRQAEKGKVARSTIDQWLVDGLNAANMQIASNDSEEILLTKNGLLARSYDDITGTYSPEQLKITHNIMAYTDDNWETVRQSIGKHEYKHYDKDENKFVDKIGYGMNADFVTAGVVSGSQIIGGDIYSDNYSITNATGSYLNLRDGTFSFGGGSLRFEKDANGNAQLLISSPDVLTKNEITTINEEYLKTTSVYAENLQVNSAKIQGKLTASQIDVDSLNADDILGETIIGKTIKSSDFIGGSLLIGDETKVDDYAEITEDGALTCTNANISGTITGSQIIGNDIEGGTITGTQIKGVDITAGSTLKVGIQKDEDGNEIENSYLTWISEDGVLNTYNANIQGTLTSPTIMGGMIIGGTITGGTLNVGTILDEEGNHTGDYYTTITEDGYLKSVEGEFEDCTITGGSLKMGNSEDGYSAWISVEDGVLHAYGAYLEDVKATSGTIGGWTITTEGLYKNVYGISSGMCSITPYFSSGLEYELINSGVSTYYKVIGIGTCSDINIIIPHQYNGYLVSVIDENAFANCNNLISVTIPDSIVSIGTYAFAYCSSLTSVIIPNSVKNIERSVFRGCSNLTNITISDSVQTINMYTFYDCSNLTSITIPNSVTTIWNYAFTNCSSLTDIYYTGTEEEWNNITIYENGNEILDTVSLHYNSEMQSNNEIQSSYTSLINSEITSPLRFFAGSNSDIPTSIDDAKFLVLEDGSLYASAANIKGHMEVTSGDIGGCSIEDGILKIKNANISEKLVAENIDGTNLSVVDGTFSGSISVNNGVFKVDTDGTMTAEKATITGGTITMPDEADKWVELGTGGGLRVLDLNSWNGYYSCAQYSANVLRYGRSTAFNGEIENTNMLTYHWYSSSPYINMEGTWALNGASISTSSDRNLKHDIMSLDINYADLFDNLQPVKFKYNNGTSERYHIGFIAQDVCEAIEDAGLTTKDFAAYVEFTNADGDVTEYGLRYEEFIALCVNEIQKLKKRVAELENK